MVERSVAREEGMAPAHGLSSAAAGPSASLVGEVARARGGPPAPGLPPPGGGRPEGWGGEGGGASRERQRRGGRPPVPDAPGSPRAGPQRYASYSLPSTAAATLSLRISSVPS